MSAELKDQIAYVLYGHSNLVHQLLAAKAHKDNEASQLMARWVAGLIIAGTY